MNAAICAEEARLRERHAWLRHQDGIALVVFAVALGTVVGLAGLYGVGWAPWWVVMPGIALGLSLLHELEHDLIHDLYFRARPWVKHALFGVIFLAKMSMDPWSRQRIHLRHHRVSGADVDVEERLIGLGMPMGPRRLLLTLIPAFSVLVWPDIHRALQREGRKKSRRRPPLWRQAARLLSAGFALLPLWVVPAALLGEAWAVLLWVIYVGPNTIRHASIAFISSTSHYFGDIPDNTVYCQNQILDHPLLWPMQLFCFNFGATHILHHYVVRQPFYLRQWVAPRVRDVLLAEGVRRNDLDTMRRANRWSKTA